MATFQVIKLDRAVRLHFYYQDSTSPVIVSFVLSIDILTAAHVIQIISILKCIIIPWL